MNVRNWYKRNVRSANLIPVVATVCNGGSKTPHVQIRLKSENKTMCINMEVKEAFDLLQQMEHCTKRYLLQVVECVDCGTKFEQTNRVQDLCDRCR